MKITETSLKDLLILEPDIFGDDRGYFFESFNQLKFKKAIGQEITFVQDNHSKSTMGVLRGLHYQLNPFAQGKLVRVVSGEVFDVAVDIRQNSPTFGRWFGVILSAKNKKQLWIPSGFAHGFLTLSDTADFLYKTTDYYKQTHERCIIWNDSELAINWPALKRNNITVTLSNKDRLGSTFSKAETFPI